MDYAELSDFVRRRMRMSHVYQPVMLITLLRSGGECPTEDIARAILSRDQSQVEYYETITNNMVGRALCSHGVVEKEGRAYRLAGYDRLTPSQVEELISLCEGKLQEYVASCGRRGCWGSSTRRSSRC